MNAAVMPREVAIVPVNVHLSTGETVLLPGEIWQLLEQATAAAADADTDPQVAFVVAFAKGLVDAGLLLVKPSDPKSTQSVTVQTYALALQGKHAAEAKAETARKMVEGWDQFGPVMHDLAVGLLSIAGRSAPANRGRLKPAFLRLRALSAVVRGNPTAGWDIDQAEPLPEALEAFLDEVWP